MLNRYRSALLEHSNSHHALVKTAPCRSLRAECSLHHWCALCQVARVRFAPLALQFVFCVLRSCLLAKLDLRLLPVQQGQQVRRFLVGLLDFCLWLRDNPQQRRYEPAISIRFGFTPSGSFLLHHVISLLTLLALSVACPSCTCSLYFSCRSSQRGLQRVRSKSFRFSFSPFQACTTLFLHKSSLF